jgi:hypothetical protein
MKLDYSVTVTDSQTRYRKVITTWADLACALVIAGIFVCILVLGSHWSRKLISFRNLRNFLMIMENILTSVPMQVLYRLTATDPFSMRSSSLLVVHTIWSVTAS